jgi:hypothetical protein
VEKVCVGMRVMRKDMTRYDGDVMCQHEIGGESERTKQYVLPMSRN